MNVRIFTQSGLVFLLLLLLLVFNIRSIDKSEALKLYLRFISKSFIVLGLLVKSVIHFELIYIFLKIYFCLFKNHRNSWRQQNLQFTGSLPKCLHQQGLDQDTATQESEALCGSSSHVAGTGVLRPSSMAFWGVILKKLE